ncbi:hypothetical protein M3P05_06195 [Sansalvadorimonas sp. 2012CJ34-2]|uniref:Uncharacterized protein n=1 Tax=Parendozoicomonas callyspongiae TaxID=2942213 RepID=A0ABT0PDY5_9GAMM|nr:hypothetical protein [Sansalvadorimonas sp. 2012CJ34-2]MCL6269530.1 hypothetical protein [Sansalvadorimonas sp. 2012CJ34-2]
METLDCYIARIREGMTCFHQYVKEACLWCWRQVFRCEPSKEQLVAPQVHKCAVEHKALEEREPVVVTASPEVKLDPSPAKLLVPESGQESESQAEQHDDPQTVADPWELSDSDLDCYLQGCEDNDLTSLIKGKSWPFPSDKAAEIFYAEVLQRLTMLRISGVQGPSLKWLETALKPLYDNGYHNDQLAVQALDYMLMACEREAKKIGLDSLVWLFAALAKYVGIQLSQVNTLAMAVNGILNSRTTLKSAQLSALIPLLNYFCACHSHDSKSIDSTLLNNLMDRVEALATQGCKEQLSDSDKKLWHQTCLYQQVVLGRTNKEVQSQRKIKKQIFELEKEELEQEGERNTYRPFDIPMSPFYQLTVIRQADRKSELQHRVRQAIIGKFRRSKESTPDHSDIDNSSPRHTRKRRVRKPQCSAERDSRETSPSSSEAELPPLPSKKDLRPLQPSQKTLAASLTTEQIQSLWLVPCPEKLSTSLRVLSDEQLAVMGRVCDRQYSLANIQLFYQEVEQRLRNGSFETLNSLESILQPMHRYQVYNDKFIERILNKARRILESDRRCENINPNELSFLFTRLVDLSVHSRNMALLLSKYLCTIEPKVDQVSFSQMLYVARAACMLHAVYRERGETDRADQVARSLGILMDKVRNKQGWRTYPLDDIKLDMLYRISQYRLHVLHDSVEGRELGKATDSPPTTSDFQRKVGTALTQLPYNLKLHEEHQLEKSGLVVDFFVEPNYVLEVDGAQYHQCRHLNIPGSSESSDREGGSSSEEETSGYSSGSSSGSGRQRKIEPARDNGKTTARRMLLRAAGYNVFNIRSGNRETIDAVGQRILSLTPGWKA